MSKTTVKRQIELSALGGISRNTLGAKNEFTIHVPSEYDYRFDSAKRQLIVAIIKA